MGKDPPDTAYLLQGWGTELLNAAEVAITLWMEWAVTLVGTGTQYRHTFLIQWGLWLLFSIGKRTEIRQTGSQIPERRYSV